MTASNLLHPLLEQRGVIPLDGGHSRALSLTDNAVDQSQLGINPLVTAAVGMNPQRPVLFGERMFDQVPVRNIKFDRIIFDDSHLVHQESERGFEADFGLVSAGWKTVEAKCRRYGLAAPIDRDKLQNANAANAVTGAGFNLAVHHQGLVANLVNLAKEIKRRDIAVATATYATGHDVTLTSGNEWDNQTNGDPRGDIRTGAELLATKAGVDLTDVDAFISRQAFNALENSPDIKERAQYTKGVSLTNSREEVASYLGVGRVFTGDTNLKTDSDPDTAVTSAWGDVCVLKLRPQPIDDLNFLDGNGAALAHHSLVSYQWQGFGVAANPFFQPMNQTFYYPFEAWELAETASTTRAYIIRNCAT